MDETCLALNDDDSLCGQIATGHLLVQNRVISVRVPICTKHKSVHNAGFAKMRATAPQR